MSKLEFIDTTPAGWDLAVSWNDKDGKKWGIMFGMNENELTDLYNRIGEALGKDKQNENS